MKKVYTAPLATEVKVEASQMLAASTIGIGSGGVDASESLSNKHRGEWGNLWK